MQKIKPYYDADENVLIIPRQRKPRAKQLNEVLLSRPAGRMHNPKDQSRQREKQQLRKLLDKDLD